MTGEITLRGRVLPIGGLKEKLLAAQHGAGCETVLVPAKNQPDVEELSKEITKGMEIRIHQGDERSHPRGICTGEMSGLDRRKNMIIKRCKSGNRLRYHQ